MPTSTQTFPDLVFVYGTLKSSQHNHHLLRGATRVDVGEATTEHRYPLVSYGLPYLLPFQDFANSKHVKGELYRVTPQQLRLLDQLERHPDYYERVPIPVSCNGRTYKAWAYFLCTQYDYDPLLEQPFLSSYAAPTEPDRPHLDS